MATTTFRKPSSAAQSAILAERFVPAAGAPVCIVPDSRAAFGHICQALAGNPSQRVKVIGVTGTNGKTSTCWLIASVLEAAGHRVGLTGTIVNSDSVAVEPSDMTTPAAPVLADWLARAAAQDCSHAVVEVSSHALAQSRTAGIEFDAACVTNVRRDHLDFHNTLQNYRDAKARLLRQLRPEGFAVLNADDRITSSFTSLAPGAALTVGIDSQAEVTADIVDRNLGDQTFLLHAGHETVPVRTRVIGDAHVYNCLTAAAVGLLYGVRLTDIVRGLEKLEKIPGRMERLDCGQPFGVFVDYAHTPDALEIALRSLRSDERATDLRLRGRRRTRPQKASADGEGRRIARRLVHCHRRQSAPRRSGENSPRHPARFPVAGKRQRSARPRGGHRLGPSASHHRRLRADRGQRARRLSASRRHQALVRRSPACQAMVVRPFRNAARNSRIPTPFAAG